MSRSDNQTKIKREIPPLKIHDAGGAELPYLYYEGVAPQIFFAHATGFFTLAMASDNRGFDTAS